MKAKANPAHWIPRLAELNIVVFPILEGTKNRPLVKWGHQATSDLEVISEWHARWPTANWGIHCGYSSFLVVDIDSQTGADYWDEMWDAHETDPWDQGKYPVVENRRGWHIYFDAPSNPPGQTTGLLHDDIDTKSGKSMVVAPGSVAKGHTYELVAGDFHLVRAAPRWLVERIRDMQPRRLLNDAMEDAEPLEPWSEWYWPVQLAQACKRIEHAPDGHQNKTIYKAACYLGLHIPDHELLRAELEAAAERGNHPAHRARPSIRSGLDMARRMLTEQKERSKETGT